MRPKSLMAPKIIPNALQIQGAVSAYRFGPFELRPRAFTLARDAVRVPISPKAFQVLSVLIVQAGRLVEKQELFQSVWADTCVEDANLSVQVAAVRRLLGVRPGGGQYIETVPTRGYRFVAPVEILRERGPSDTNRRGPVGAATARRAGPRARLAVLPLTILRRDAETDFLAFSLPDAVAASLAESPSIQVRSPLASSSHRTAGVELATLAATTGSTLALAGTQLRLGDQLRVTVQLLALPGATVCWSASFTRPLDALADLERLVTQQVRRVVADGCATDDLGGERSHALPSGRGYAFYLRANQLAYEASQWTQARALYEEALALDPDFAPAWAGLGRCHRVIGKFSTSADEAGQSLARAEDAFKRALTIDPDLSAAHNLYAQLEVDIGHAVDAMVRLLARVDRHPFDPQICAGLVHALRFCGLLEESVAAHVRARALDSTVPTSVHHTWWMMGDYERALSETYGDIGYMPGLALASMGRDREAVVALSWRERETRDNVIRPYLSSLRAQLEGKRQEALSAVAEATKGQLDAEALFYLARTCARLGEVGLALDVLERVVAGGFVCHETFSRDPWLARLSGCERFEALVDRASRRSRRAREIFEEAGGLELLA